MTATWDATQHDVTGSPTPVILPLRADEEHSTVDHKTGSVGELNGGLQFSFPELPPPAMEPPAAGAPIAVWPACGQPEVVRACAEAAENIYRRLQPKTSTILALTSPCDGDGKTSLMISLAPELAKRVGGMLAIDADFRKADLSARLILSACTATTDSSALIYPTNRPGLNVLPMSSLHKFAASTLHNGQGLTASSIHHWNREWFADLRDRWPLVLLDTPSLEHEEPTPITRYCDGVYLVVRLGRTPQRAVAEAVEAINARGGRLLGNLVVG